MKRATPYRQERDYLLRQSGASVSCQRSRRRSLAINESDYVAAPTPSNLPLGVAGDCLVWRGGLSGDGYGAISYQGHSHKVHRLAWEQSRGKRVPEGMNVNHLCNRRFCVQPSHLYCGTSSENAQDRKMRFAESPFGGMTWNQFGKFWDRAFDAAEYWRESPANPPAVQLPLPGMHGPTLPHECLRKIPAGDSKICIICGLTEWECAELPENMLSWPRYFPNCLFELPESPWPIHVSQFDYYIERAHGGAGQSDP